MKNLQKGFIVPLLIGIIALLIIGGGLYIYKIKKTEIPAVVNNTAQDSNQIQKTNTQNSSINNQQNSPSATKTPPTNSIPVKSSITISSPNGGEIYKTGNTATINWNSSGFSNQDKVYIAITNYNNGHFDTKLINSGETPITQVQYNWIIPSNYKTGSMYKISIYTDLKKYIDSSDNYFTITN